MSFQPTLVASPCPHCPEPTKKVASGENKGKCVRCGRFPNQTAPGLKCRNPAGCENRVPPTDALCSLCGFQRPGSDPSLEQDCEAYKLVLTDVKRVCGVLKNKTWFPDQADCTIKWTNEKEGQTAADYYRQGEEMKEYNARIQFCRSRVEHSYADGRVGNWFRKTWTASNAELSQYFGVVVACVNFRILKDHGKAGAYNWHDWEGKVASSLATQHSRYPAPDEPEPYAPPKKRDRAESNRYVPHETAAQRQLWKSAGDAAREATQKIYTTYVVKGHRTGKN